MLNLLVGVAIGLVAGWLLPQPAWFKTVVEKVKALVAK